MSTATPKIRGLTVRTLRMLVPEPHVTASGTIADSPLVLTDLQCDDGSVGHSLLLIYTPVALKQAADLMRNPEPLLAGQPAAPLEAAASAGLLTARHPRPDRHGDGCHRHGAAVPGERQIPYLHVLFHRPEAEASA
jgi:mandelate racemase